MRTRSAPRPTVTRDEPKPRKLWAVRLSRRIYQFLEQPVHHLPQARGVFVWVARGIPDHRLKGAEQDLGCGTCLLSEQFIQMGLIRHAILSSAISAETISAGPDDLAGPALGIGKINFVDHTILTR